MKLIITLCALTSLAAAAVIPEDAKAEIVEYQNSNDGAGNYEFSYKTSNGLVRQESGHLVNVGKEDEHMVVTGAYSYTDVEGKLVIIKYTADENGYQVGEPQRYPEIHVKYDSPKLKSEKRCDIRYNITNEGEIKMCRGGIYSWHDCLPSVGASCFCSPSKCGGNFIRKMNKPTLALRK